MTNVTNINLLSQLNLGSQNIGGNTGGMIGGNTGGMHGGISPFYTGLRHAPLEKVMAGPFSGNFRGGSFRGVEFAQPGNMVSMGDMGKHRQHRQHRNAMGPMDQQQIPQIAMLLKRLLSLLGAGGKGHKHNQHNMMAKNNPFAENNGLVKNGTHIVNSQRPNGNFTGLYNHETGTKFGQLTGQNAVATRISGNINNLKYTNKFVNSPNFTGRLTSTQFDDAKYRYNITNRQGWGNSYS